MNRPVITRAEGDLLYGSDGRVYVDLFTGHGTVLLGHGDREIVDPVAEQLRAVWTTAGLANPGMEALRRALAPFIGPGLELKLLYSTGMEAAEFAIRFARVATGKPVALGFEGNMHGKSYATARLGWDDLDEFAGCPFERLPYLASLGEEALLERLADRLARGDIGSVFVEPIQGTAGGLAATRDFHESVEALCRRHGSLLVFDEILTGLHRAGPPFMFRELGVAPDLLLLGKALGNGFPVSGVALRPEATIEPAMLPGSTFAGNPLATAAALATLKRMESLDIERLVADVGAVVEQHLADLRMLGVGLRGRGALWIATMPAGADLLDAVRRIHARGVAVGHTGNQLRLLPPATITPARLKEACTVVGEEIRVAVSRVAKDATS